MSMKKKTVGDLLSRFHHVGVLVRSVDEAAEYYECLGMGSLESSNLVHLDRKVYGRPVTDVRNAARVGKLGPIGFEVIQPLSGETPQKEWLERQGEGINHIAFIVDDIEEAISTMVEAGFQVIASSRNEGGGGMAYFDTDKVGGVQIELEELPPHLEDDRYWGLTPWVHS